MASFFLYSHYEVAKNMLILNIILQVLGAISLYYWFFSNSRFFYLMNKHKNGNPVLLFFLPLGFIGFPAILAFCFKVSWDYFNENDYLLEFVSSLIPLVIFGFGIIIFKKINTD